MAQTKIIRTGIKFTCRAQENLTQYNKSLNKTVHNTCWQKPKFNVQATCDGCPYLEVKEYAK